MGELLLRFQSIIAVGLAVTVPLFSLYFHGKLRTETTAVERALTAVTGPVQEAAYGITDSVGGIWSDYVYLVDVKSENEELRRHNQVIAKEAVVAKQLRQENARLRQLLSFREEKADGNGIAARVVGKDISPHYLVVKLVADLGSEQGISAGMPAVTYEGLVGRVSRVGLDYCEVMLSADSRSRVNVKIEGKGVIGVLQGRGDEHQYTARFRFLHRSEPVDVGDTIVTSGHDQVFPAGLVVGYVTDSEMRQDGLYYEYDIVPAVNFSTLEEVLILTDPQAPGMGDEAADAGQ